MIPAVSLYTGAGGLDLGFLRAGFDPVFANDIDPSAPASYEAVLAASDIERDHSRHTYVVGDISSDYSVIGRREDAVLFGGPPCQGFSRAGRMDPDDPRSQHVRRFVQAVGVVRPRAFVMENVRALATHPRWSAVLADLQRLARETGYETHLLLLNAKDYGVPQSRERMFLVGVPVADEALLDQVEKGAVASPVSVRDGIHASGPGPTWQRCRAAIVPAKNPVMRVSPFAGMFFNGQGRPLDLDAPAPTISASLGGNHTPIVDQAWLDDPTEGGRSVREYQESLVAGRTPNVPSTWRRISLQEAAALQSFPPSVDWVGPLSSRYRHVGNAVPPLLGYEVARRVARMLGMKNQAEARANAPEVGLKVS